MWPQYTPVALLCYVTHTVPAQHGWDPNGAGDTERAREKAPRVPSSIACVTQAAT